MGVGETHERDPSPMYVADVKAKPGKTPQEKEECIAKKKKDPSGAVMEKAKKNNIHRGREGAEPVRGIGETSGGRHHSRKTRESRRFPISQARRGRRASVGPKKKVEQISTQQRHWKKKERTSLFLSRQRSRRPIGLFRWESIENEGKNQATR